MENNKLIKHDDSLVKRVGNAIAITGKLLTLKANIDPYTYYLSGIEKYNKSEYNEAIDNFSKAILLNPQYASAYCNRGVSKCKLGKLLEAIEDYSKAIETKQGKPEDYYYLRGRAYNDLNNYSEAIIDFSYTIEINPQHAGAYNDRGSAYKGLNNYTQAINDYSKAIEINPNFYYGAIYYNRGNVKHKIGDKSACEDWLKAKDLGTTYAEEKLKKYCI